MSTELAQYIQQTPLVDSHEHLCKEQDYLDSPPDILQNLFANYVTADLVVGGAKPDAMNALTNSKDPDIKTRFEGVRKAWEASKHTGYGEAVRYIAKHLYKMDEITPDALESAQELHQQWLGSGKRYAILREMGNLDHVQTDDFCWPCLPDESGPEFFFYDLSWASFCGGKPDFKALAEETGIEVTGLETLRDAMGILFDKYARCAIAIKAQHAYNRTLQWHDRSDTEAESALNAYLSNPDEQSEEDRLCLGDWCWARGIELGIDHDLAFKIHTGYYAGHSRMPVDYIRSGNMCNLLAKYIEARFVLMHISYPYNDELVALAKHYPNVYPDLCWAWSIDPYSSSDFVRRCIHAVPSNKIFIFGGDTRHPSSSIAYAWQARRWLTHALEGEVNEGLLTEKEAIALAGRLMRENQYECLRVEDKRRLVTEAMSEAAAG
jgi:hypothetical protein